MEAARAINNQLHTNLYVEETNRSISELKGILDGLSVGVITWDNNYHINHINSKAESILEINSSDLVGKSLWSAISYPPSIINAVQEEQELDNLEFNVKIQGRAINVSASLRRIYDSDRQLNGSVMILRPIEDVHQLIYRQGKSNQSIRFEQIVAHSSVMQSTLRQARIAAQSGTPILLWGESGVGKNFLARAIHNESQRADKPFVSVNCGAIPHELMLDTLFGYGYQDDTRHGLLSKLELAHRGTLLLDQIHALPLEVKNSLLDVIETGTIAQLGENWAIPLDVRIIGTTPKDLSVLSQAGLFLPDLYFRFGVTNLRIPPLRERVDEIPELVLRFLNYLSKRMELKDPIRVEDGVMDVLKQYSWPGNVRELENTLESAVYKRYDHILRVADLPSFVRIGGSEAQESEMQPVMSAAEAEREAVIRAGWACEGRVGEMAELLGMGRTTLWRKMREMNISANYFKR
jgi:transcriptional activator for dhaKLM operon